MLLLFFSSRPVHAQAYSIQLELDESINDTVLLAHYYNGNILVNDTLVTDQNGMAMFKGTESLPQGIYTLYFDAQKQIDFLIGEDQLLAIQEKNGELKVSGSTESARFQAYVDFLNERKKQAANLQERLNQLGEQADSISHIKQQLRGLDNEVQKYWQQEGENAAGSFYGKFAASNIPVTIEEEEIPAEFLANDSLLWAFKYNFNKDHYWDHFDLFDIRMWRTPTIQSRLNEYFNKVLIQTADSVLPSAIQLIEASNRQPEIFQNLVSFVLNNSVKSDYMGIENVFVAIAEKYYLTGRAFWASDKTIQNIRHEVYFRKNNLIGSTAKELLLEDENGEYQSLHQQSTPFTLLVFWEPECGHCKKVLPALFEEVFLKINPSKLTVIAVYTQDKKEEWLDFITKHELNGWINVWDPHRASNFQVNYNVRTTPMIYLLDQDKKILAKKLSVENAKEILEELIINGQSPR
jgi:thiol-disulfide isomerase/thioredoxin